MLTLHIVPGRNRQDRSQQRDALVAESYSKAHGKVAASGMADAGDVLGANALVNERDILCHAQLGLAIGVGHVRCGRIGRALVGCS